MTDITFMKMINVFTSKTRSQYIYRMVFVLATTGLKSQPIKNFQYKVLSSNNIKR